MHRSRRRLLTSWAGVWTLAIAVLALALPMQAQGFGPGDDQAEEVVWSIWISQEQAHPGDTIVVALIAEVTHVPDGEGKHWHFYPRAADYDTDLFVEKPTRISSGPF